MNVNSAHVELVDFNGIDATNTLLRQVGVGADLGQFLAEHVQNVLRQQYADLSLKLVKLVSIGDCTVGGQEAEERQTVRIDSLSIPIVIEAVVIVQKETHCLELAVTVRAKATGVTYQVDSDIVVQRQSRA